MLADLETLLAALGAATVLEELSLEGYLNHYRVGKTRAIAARPMIKRLFLTFGQLPCLRILELPNSFLRRSEPVQLTRAVLASTSIVHVSATNDRYPESQWEVDVRTVHGRVRWVHMAFSGDAGRGKVYHLVADLPQRRTAAQER